MKGLFDGTKDLKPMFITGGIDEGIIKYIGEARAKYNPSAVNTPAHSGTELASRAVHKRTRALRCSGLFSLARSLSRCHSLSHTHTHSLTHTHTHTLSLSLSDNLQQLLHAECRALCYSGALSLSLSLTHSLSLSPSSPHRARTLSDDLRAATASHRYLPSKGGSGYRLDLVAADGGENPHSF